MPTGTATDKLFRLTPPNPSHPPPATLDSPKCLNCIFSSLRSPSNLPLNLSASSCILEIVNKGMTAPAKLTVLEGLNLIQVFEEVVKVRNTPTMEV